MIRRRVVRDLGTIAGIAVILAGVVGLNIYYRLDSLKAKYDAIRRTAEATRAKQGVELLSWDDLRKTKGNLRSGPTFDPAVVERAKDGRSVNLMGFMTPIDQFKNVSHFMLLPLPIQCYFCEMPPIRDVMLVRMNKGEVVDIVEEPVLISGRLVLNDGPGHKFFYSIEEATWAPGHSNKPLTTKTFSQQHRQESYQLGGQLLEDSAKPEEKLLPPVQDEQPAAREVGPQ